MSAEQLHPKPSPETLKYIADIRASFEAGIADLLPKSEQLPHLLDGALAAASAEESENFESYLDGIISATMSAIVRVLRTMR